MVAFLDDIKCLRCWMFLYEGLRIFEWFIFTSVIKVFLKAWIIWKHDIKWFPRKVWFIDDGEVAQEEPRAKGPRCGARSPNVATIFSPRVFHDSKGGIGDVWFDMWVSKWGWWWKIPPWHQECWVHHELTTWGDSSQHRGGVWFQYNDQYKNPRWFRSRPWPGSWEEMVSATPIGFFFF